MKTSVGLSLLMSTLISVGAAQPPCQAVATPYRGWQALKLANELITLHVVPPIGGRVIQLELGNHPYFWVNPELAGKVFPPEENGGPKGGWKNYGGDKLWPAPQGWERDDQWPGPPDPVLDGGRYVGQITQPGPEEAALTLSSPPDERTGLQFRRTVRVRPGSTRVEHECTMKNVSRRPVRWGLWQVIQLDTADARAPEKWNDDFWAYCPLHPQSAHPRGFSPMFGQATHPSWRADTARGLFTAHYDYRVGKAGLDSPGGWLAVCDGQTEHCFIVGFTFQPGAPYPDQASVEFWLNGAGEFILNGQSVTNAADPKQTPYLMEAEVLSPLVDLAPGQEYPFRLDWYATRCPRPVVEVTPAGAVNQALRATEREGKVRLEGVFGVFEVARAEGVFKDALGQVVGREDLGAVDPRQVFRLDRELAVPKGSFRVSVNVLDRQGRNLGTLGNALLE